jgi:hypothetical protein
MEARDPTGAAVGLPPDGPRADAPRSAGTDRHAGNGHDSRTGTSAGPPLSLLSVEKKIIAGKRQILLP